ncbi:MAG: cyclase family protein [Dehalococcoidia bacterium]
MRLVDLTRLLDPSDIERLPPERRAGATPLFPLVKHIEPEDEGARVMSQIFGCTPEDLPDGEGWGDEHVRMSTHLGTHVDAPLHYGSKCEGKPSRTISDIAIEELYCPAIVLDLRGRCSAGSGIEVTALQAALDANGAKVEQGSAVLLRTGQEKFGLSDREFFNYPGMTREGTLFLSGLGAKVLGTDALGWDRPFAVMAKAFKETGERAQIWDGHFAGREREVFIVQQMANLVALPPSGFHVGFFPMRLKGCSAAPARVVAFLS